MASLLEVAPALDGARYIQPMIVYRGEIYAGIHRRQPNQPNAGSIQRWNGSDAWVEIAAELPDIDRLWQFISFDAGAGSELFVASGFFQSAPPDSGERGALLKVDTDGGLLSFAANSNNVAVSAIECTALLSQGTTVLGAIRQNAEIVEWDGITSEWVSKVAPTTGHNYNSIDAIVRFQDKIYMGTGAGGADDGGRLLEYTGTTVVTILPQSTLLTILDLKVFEGILYAIGTPGSAVLFSWDGVAATWTTVATGGSIGQGHKFHIIGGELYAVFDRGVLKFDGVSAWETIVTPNDGDEDFTGSTVFLNRLYIGTGDVRAEPNLDNQGGKLYEIDLGLSVPGLEDLQQFAAQKKFDGVDYFTLMEQLLPRGMVWVLRFIFFNTVWQDNIIGGNPNAIDTQDVLDPATNTIQDIPASQIGEGSQFSLLISCFSSELNKLDSFINDLITESVAGLSTTPNGLLDRWESQAGIPDECTANLGLTQTQGERQSAVHAKLYNESQTVTSQFLIDYAATFGFTITVDEKSDNEDGFIIGVGIMGVGVLGTAGENTVIEITVVEGSGNLELLICIFNRIKPAHTILIFIS